MGVIKIIEYDGEYYHDKEHDDKRDDVLKKMGFKTLRISSDDFNRNNKSEVIIDKCVGFLNDN